MKKSEREAKKQEKEQKKIERETARRLEREAAKLEKLNRKHENISRSTERVSGGRSGSLERRRSGDDGPVLNQSTVHGKEVHREAYLRGWLPDSVQRLGLLFELNSFKRL